MNLKKFVASLVLLTQATNAFAIGQASTQVYADKVKSVTGTGTINVNTANTWTIPNATDTAVGKATTDTLTNKTLTSPAISGATMSGVTAFPGTSSVDGSGNAIFGGTGNIAGATLIGAAGSADSKSVFELQSTTKGFLPPRMTTAQKNAIVAPTTGLVVYDSDLKSIQVYNGTSWVTAGSGGLSYAADTGAANAYVIAPTPAALAYTTGDTYIFKAVNANTAASTLNVSALGVKNIKTPQVANLPANAILANAIVMVVYDGTQFQIISQQDPTRVSPLTTKGDIHTYSTLDLRHAVPGDYGRSVPDSGATDGWRNVTYSQLQQGRPGKNYVQYSDFENNATTGWTATGCATVTNGLPACNGSGGTAFSSANGGRAKGANTNSPAIDSGSSVAGTYALNYATTGAGVIGDGYVSSLLPIDPADRGKVLSWKLSYKVASGTPVMGGTSADTYAVAIYDPVNNSWLGTAGQFNFVQSSGVGFHQGTFQTLTTTTSVQLFVYSPIAPTGTSSLLIDDVLITPQVLSFGPAMGDWIAYTPTLTSGGGGAVTLNATGPTNPNGFWRRDGDSAEIIFSYRNGSGGGATGAAGTVQVSLPTGLTIDTTKTETGVAGGPVYGVCATNATNYTGLAIHQTTTAVRTTDGLGTTTTVAILVASFGVACRYKVPIVGWSSNSVQSADSDTRVIAAEMQYSGTAAMTNNVLVPWDTPVYDTTASYNTGSGAYVVPVTGKYRISCGFNSSNTAAAAINNVFTLRVYINTVADKYCATVYAQTTSAHAKNGAGQVTLNLKAGDSIEIRSVVSAVNGHTFSGDTGLNYFMIERVSGPAVTAATETVVARYTSSAATGVVTDTTMDFATKVYDSHNAVTTGAGWVFTAPVSGTYSVSEAMSTSAATCANVDNVVGYYLSKNGATTGPWMGMRRCIILASNAKDATGTADIKLLAGETVALKGTNNTGSAHTLNASSDSNHIEIRRVGNY